MEGTECYVSEIHSYCCMLPSLIAKKHSILGIYNLFIHSSVNEHLVCFQAKAVMHKATIHIFAQVFFCGPMVLFSWIII